MEKFSLYGEAFIFFIIFAILVLVPCFLIVLIGRSMMDEIGRFPTKVAVIQVRAVMKLLVVEVVAFLLLISFYRAFSG